MTWTDAAVVAVAVSLASLGLLGVVLIRIERLDRRLKRVAQRGKAEAARLGQADAERKSALHDLRAEWAQSFHRLASREELGKQLEATRKALGARHDGLLKRLDGLRDELKSVRKEDVPRLLNEQKRRFEVAADHVTRQGRRDYEQQVAWSQLQAMLRPERMMPALRGWAASPDVLCLLVAAIRAHSPALVVECGSGASTIWLGLAMRRFGGGRLVALEHELRYAERSRALVADHGLDDMVDVRLAPLRPWTGDDGAAGQPWYDLDAVADLREIDLLFVDGPPLVVGPQARYPAGPVLLPRCSPRCVVVLDDTGRPDDRATSDRWMEANPDLERTTIDTEKGTHLLVRQPRTAHQADLRRTTSSAAAAGTGDDRPTIEPSRTAK